MTASNLAVIQSSSPDAHIRSELEGTDGVTGKPIIAQVVKVKELYETPVAPSPGGVNHHSITSAASAALDPPDAAADYARLRVWNAGASSVQRLFYTTDGATPLANGTNACGYLMHGDVFLCKLATKTNFKMIAETGDAFEVWVEWFNQ